MSRYQELGELDEHDVKWDPNCSEKDKEALSIMLQSSYGKGIFVRTEYTSNECRVENCSKPPSAFEGWELYANLAILSSHFWPSDILCRRIQNTPEKLLKN